jgi:dihydrofolate reductase
MKDIAPSIALVAAVAANGVIGAQGGLPWHLPEDLKWFKQVTLGKAVVMGRLTWQSIGRPLPGRANIVLTSDTAWHRDGAHPAHSLAQALELAARLTPSAHEVAVIGGARVFAEALPLARRLYLTEIHRDYPGDTWFPEVDRSQWREVSRTVNPGSPNFDFLVLERAGS